MLKVVAVAVNAWKETVRQPVYYVILLVSGAMIALSHFFALFTFGQEAKFVYDMGLATITLATLFQALFSASTVISDEIEKKTVLTVLSKPLARWEFIVGKFLGVAGAVLPATVILGVILLLATYWSTVDPYVGHHEHSGESHSHAHVEGEAEGDHEKEWDENTLIGFTMVAGPSFAKATFMIYMQVAMLAAVSVAVSTRMPMLLNLVICSGVFVLGNLTEYLRVLLGGLGKIPGILGGILYTVVPNLSHFSIVGQKAAVGIQVSGTYILLATVYGVGYIMVALIFAFLLFRTREVG
jgi:hypothetical protein